MVVHPRYGDEVVSTGCSATADEVLAAYRHQDAIQVFVESAVRADVRKQNHEWTSPKYFYADVLRSCKRCRRKFIFFAREQRFWFEELKINVATTAKLCCECAEGARSVEAALQRYQQTWPRSHWDDDSLVQLATDLVTLRKAEILRSDQRLLRVRNQLRARSIAPEKWALLENFLSK